VPDRDDSTWIIERARERLRDVAGYEPSRWFLVDVAHQRLLLLNGSTITREWRVSTAAVGLDASEDSGGTPPGVHRIHAMIGGDEPPGTVFADREPTGEMWSPGMPPDGRDLILSRILTLEGLEAGVNRGPGIDTRERYIYLHGTNDESRLGEAVSHGCVRLGHRDVLEVFDAATVGDLVVVG
jgi:UDP-N-acetylmuramate--alanine ligase